MKKILTNIKFFFLLITSFLVESLLALLKNIGEVLYKPDLFGSGLIMLALSIMQLKSDPFGLIILGAIILFLAVCILTFKYYDKILNFKLIKFIEDEFQKTESILSNTSYIKKCEKEIKIKVAAAKKVTNLNKAAKDSQIEILRREYTETSFSIIDSEWEKEHTPNEQEEAINKIKNWSITKKREFAMTLYNLCVAEDGIKEDEWDQLQQMVRQLKLGTYYTNKLKEYWEPLRYREEEEANTIAFNSANLENCYALLGLESNATANDVRNALRKMALEYHPDLIKNAERREFCEKKMKEINIAYSKITAQKAGVTKNIN
ncbi:MAG: J domain-containing protein [Paludibacteraceae bacterium]|nr:J domain-containing protein [Paludibacteraceae bacterium]